MADSFTISVDATNVLRALERLGTAAEEYVLAAAQETANAIAREGRARRLRAQSPQARGKTAEAITVQPLSGRSIGYQVFVDPSLIRPRPANVALWLEVGTTRMLARPFLLSAGTLEEGPHLRRIAEALQAATETR